MSNGTFFCSAFDFFMTRLDLKNNKVESISPETVSRIRNCKYSPGDDMAYRIVTHLTEQAKQFKNELDLQGMFEKLRTDFLEKFITPNVRLSEQEKDEYGAIDDIVTFIQKVLWRFYYLDKEPVEERVAAGDDTKLREINNQANRISGPEQVIHFANVQGDVVMGDKYQNNNGPMYINVKRSENE